MYHVVFRTIAECIAKGAITWTSFKSKEDFDKWYDEDMREWFEVVEREVSEGRAITLCGGRPVGEVDILKEMGKETDFAHVPLNHLFVGADFQIYMRVKEFMRGGKEYNAVVIQKLGGQMGRAESFAYGDWAFLFNPGRIRQGGEAMSKELREAIKLLEDEVEQLDRWADEMSSGGWSTYHVEPMRNRAEFLRNRVNALKVQANGL